MCEACEYTGYIPEYDSGHLFATNMCENCLALGLCPKCGEELEQETWDGVLVGCCECGWWEEQ